MGYRYIVKYNNMKFTHYILDTKTGEKLGYREMCEILNQQDKRIKELEEELQNYKICRCVDCTSETEKLLEQSLRIGTRKSTTQTIN